MKVARGYCRVSTQIQSNEDASLLTQRMKIECEYDEPQKVGDYTIWQYPDSVGLQLKAEGDKLFFGYCR